jgi:hypothetical protein
MQRYKIDAQAELHTIECKLATARKSLDRTANRNTAATELSKIPGLERKAEALRAEIPTLPERPACALHMAMAISPAYHGRHH